MYIIRSKVMPFDCAIPPNYYYYTTISSSSSNPSNPSTVLHTTHKFKPFYSNFNSNFNSNSYTWVLSIIYFPQYPFHQFQYLTFIHSFSLFHYKLWFLHCTLRSTLLFKPHSLSFSLTQTKTTSSQTHTETETERESLFHFMAEQDMTLSLNGHSQVPPGFRFHPTEEELLHYYLRKKVGFQKIDLDVIRDVDLNKLEPWDIQGSFLLFLLLLLLPLILPWGFSLFSFYAFVEKCKIGSTPQNDWYFFSHKDKKYPTGTRTNRATAAGFWKATGRDKIIYTGSRRIGLRKTLVFYKGRAPHGQKSDWIMHEYRLDDSDRDNNVSSASNKFTLNSKNRFVSVG